MCFLCDYGWILLICLIVALALALTSDYWLPWFGETPAIPTPISITQSESTAVQSPLTSSSPTPVGLFGYINSSGGYAFDYPGSWQGLETGTDAHFQLPNGAKVQIAVRDAIPSDTLQTIAEDSGPIVLAQADISNTIVGGEPALKSDCRNGDNVVISRTYYVIHNGRIYYFSLFSSLDKPLPSNFTETLNEFDQMVSSLYFLQP